ncbi:tetratricopeptide repeat protein [Chitinophaga sp. G-6-1-13]|uniref:Tetratricopeptide repeat protein n=1 Tax=Chitinophaga fulva TaxID=2728842 RepID=A0A848GQA4_9BACT|nr:tetratricopeptide repeat protein [Chitinophaga fulva]NML39731.1 tetratricopeptide repeat protein [Chitinophaga fulva]
MRLSLLQFPLALLLIAGGAYAQQDSIQAREKAIAAIRLMDSGEPEKSIPLLEEAAKLDPKNLAWPYEMAYAYYQMKDYDKSLGILKKLARRDDTNDRVFQLLGNSYDMLDKREKAIEAYEKGLKLFPAAGNLYLERGVMEIIVKDYNKALAYFEAGIKAAPMFASNYYWAAKIFCNNTEEEVWGMIYGEIFLNLERNTRRTVEISKALYLTYKSEIKFNGDTATVSFSKNNVINVAYDVKDGADALADQLKNLQLPYGGLIFEPNMAAAVGMEKDINLQSLNRIRARFLEFYQQKFRKMAKAPIVLFDYQQQVNDAGLLEPYNYWILGYGQEQEFANWRAANEDLFKRFLEWLKDHPLTINEENQFYRTRY